MVGIGQIRGIGTEMIGEGGECLSSLLGYGLVVKTYLVQIMSFIFWCMPTNQSNERLASLALLIVISHSAHEHWYQERSQKITLQQIYIATKSIILVYRSKKCTCPIQYHY